MKGYVVLFLAIASCSCQIIQDGSCPDVSVVQDFDPYAYSGQWYEVASYPSIFEDGGECPKAQYTVLDDGTVGVRNSMVFGTLEVHLEGKAVQVGTEGVLLVTFNFNDGIVSSTSKLNILETDYSGYAVAFSCNNNDDGTRRITSWILSRTRTLSVDASEAVDAIIKSIEGLDENLFVYKNNDENACFSAFSATYD